MKIIKINACNICPYFRWRWDNDYCILKNYRRIKDIEKIPKWCPLENLEINSNLNKSRFFKCKSCGREFYVPYDIYTVNCPCGETGYSYELTINKGGIQV